MSPPEARVYSVDDEKPVLDDIKKTLLDSGHISVGQALSVEDFMRDFENFPKLGVQVVTLDDTMYGSKRGSEMARIIRDRYPDIKIVIVSSSPSGVEPKDKGCQKDFIEGWLGKIVTEL